MIVRFFLWCYDNLATILSVLTIAITVILTGGQIKPNENSASKKKTFWSSFISFLFSARFRFAVFFLVSAVIIIGGGFHAHDTWAIVPDLYGRTYDDAIRTLYENGLNGQLALADTNNDLSNSDSRIVWQSFEKESIVEKGTPISFLIDDCFSLTSTPLYYYSFKDDAIDQTTMLEYTCDYKDATHQRALRDRAALENGTAFDYTPLDEPHWDIEIKAINIYGDAYSTVMSSGIPYTTMNYIYSYKKIGRAMSLTLEQVIKESVDYLTRYSIKPDLNDSIVVGKLIPISENNTGILRSISVPNYLGEFFFPQILASGEYKFTFCIIDSDYQMHEWYHNVTIVDRWS